MAENTIHHYRETLKIGMPIVIGQLGVIVLGFADTMMVGHYNTPSLAAASFVNNIFTLVSITLMGFSYGITPLVSALFARKQYDKAGATVKNALYANLIFGAAVISVMTALYFFLDKLGQPEELLPLMRPYYIVILVSMAFIVLFNVFRQFTDGITYTRLAMWVLLGGNAFNIVFNYLLIYGKFGFPELGLLGAGISTMSSRIAMAAAIMLIIWRDKRFRAYREGFVKSAYNGMEIRRIMKISFPISLQMGMETGTFTFGAVMAGWLGAIPLASFQVMVTVSMLGFMFYYGIGAALAIRVASFEGLGDVRNVRRAASSGYRILLMLAFVSSVVFFSLSDYLISFFTDDAAVAATCLSLIPALILYQFGDATQICFANALRGTSHVMSMMWIAFVSYILIGIPSGYIFGFPCGFGEHGIFYAFSIALFSAAILFCVKFYRVIGGQSHTR